MKIEVGKEYKTRGGQTMLVVYKSQVGKEFQFLAINKEDDDDAYWYTDDGRLYQFIEDDEDLVSPAPKKINVSAWANVCPSGVSILYESKDHADACASDSRIACKRIEFEVEEGEGL